tara:strand:- start:196 stop:1245 length:1050 start_codon:yes stop_codon:yes gene_type:complete
MKIIVTGGAGFIGSALIKLLIKKKHKVLNIDKITYASDLRSLKRIKNNRNYIFKKADICNEKLIQKIIFNYKPDAIFNLAAETHVDRSIESQSNFIKTNILGTFVLLKSSRIYFENKKKKLFKFIHISTDEVYGDLKLNEKSFTEESRYKPSSPYSASKASSDHLVRSWFKTFKFPGIITNCSNNYGPFQFPEKFIPHMIISGLLNKKLPVYGSGRNIRDWLHVEDHVNALYLVLKKGKTGETYNIGGDTEKKNIDVVNLICEQLNKMKIRNNFDFKSLIAFVQDRPGHDKRYSINTKKIKSELKWKPKYKFENGLRSVIKWYIDNSDWWKSIIIKKYKIKRMGIINDE